MPRQNDFSYPAYARWLWVAGLAGLVTAHLAGFARRWGRAIPLIALALIVVYWGALAAAHKRAETLARSFASRLASQNGETVRRVAAMPTLANPMLWRCLAESDRATYRFDISLGEKRNGESVTSLERYGVASDDGLVALAARDYRAKIFLGFARFPTARVRGDCVSQTLVQFADLRYTEPGAERRGTFSLDIPVECSPETGELRKR